MDINNNQLHPGQRSNKAHARNFTFETQLLTLSDDELNEIATKLNHLGVHFDPFSGKKSKQDRELIRALELELFLDDPFQFTNIILKRLDEIETEIKRRNR